MKLKLHALLLLTVVALVPAVGWCDGHVLGCSFPLVGTVTGVDGSEGIEISLGTDDLLKLGDVIQITRGNKHVGRLVIRATGPERAIGRIDSKLCTIQKGDVATWVKRSPYKSITH